MMWPARSNLLLAALIATAVLPSAGGSPPDATAGNGRIRVPLGRALADVVAPDRSHPDPAAAPARRYEIEADDGTADGASLRVERVERPAVTDRTTYRFREGRDFDRERVGDVSLLASDPRDGEGLTIVSVNEASGEARGFRRGLAGDMHRISVDSERRRLRLERMERSLEEARGGKKWTCDAEHAHDDFEDPVRSEHHRHGHGDHDHHDHPHGHVHGVPLNAEFTRSSSSSIRNPGSTRQVGAGWIENPHPNYAFHVDLSIDIDESFIQKQGSAEAAVEYINVLVSAANVVFEHEVDAHLNIIHIQETDIYDEITTTRDALREMKLHPRPYQTEGDTKIALHHAMLGRYVGGGIAFIDSVCDAAWGYGVTGDISGSLRDIDELVLFDLFIISHEIGHSLGSGHTFDAYDPPVDGCGECADASEGGFGAGEVAFPGLPRKGAATIMSYCNMCEGGLENIALTLGGVWDGEEPRSDVDRWADHPDIAGDVSVDPRRVSHNVWKRLASKGECVRPPSGPLPVQGCNEDRDCDDNNECTTDVCNELYQCEVSSTIENDCCGNGKCEAGESQSCSDCGPYHVRAPRFCKKLNGCHKLDGFMIDVGLSNKARRNIYISSIGLAYSSPKNIEATIDVYVTTSGSYVGKETSPANWERVGTMMVSRYNSNTEGILLAEIPLHHHVPLGVGDRRGFYFSASEDVILFGERPYSARNDHGAELYSSLAVSGLFGDGIDGFALSCEVGYMLDGVDAEDAKRTRRDDLDKRSEDESGDSWDGDRPPPTAGISGRLTPDPVAPSTPLQLSNSKSEGEVQRTVADDLFTSFFPSSSSSGDLLEEEQVDSPAVGAKILFSSSSGDLSEEEQLDSPAVGVKISSSSNSGDLFAVGSKDSSGSAHICLNQGVYIATCLLIMYNT